MTKQCSTHNELLMTLNNGEYAILPIQSLTQGILNDEPIYYTTMKDDVVAYVSQANFERSKGHLVHVATGKYLFPTI